MLKEIHVKYIFAPAFLFVFIVGAVLRLYDLNQVPPGLWYDEAWYAEKAMQFLNGDPRLVYFQRNEAQFGFFPMLLALGFWSMGDALVAPRMVMALWGMLGIIGCYLLSLELFHAQKNRHIIALLSAALLATSYWHLNFSRLIFSASLVPTFEVFSLFLTLRAFRLADVRMAVLAGFITALGLYSYWQFYSFMLLPAFIALTSLRNSPRKQSQVFLAYLLTGVIVSAPLGYAFMEYDVVQRLRDASVFVEPGISFVNNVLSWLWRFVLHVVLHLSMLFFEGDHNWRHNLSGQPQLSMLASVGVLLAIIECYGKKKLTHPEIEGRKPINMLFLWAFFALLPAVLSWEGLPHSSRAIGMVIPMQIIAAYGLLSLRAWVGKGAVLNAYTALLIFAFIIQLAMTAHRYFIIFPEHPKAKEAFLLLDDSLLRYNFAREAQQ